MPYRIVQAVIAFIVSMEVGWGASTDGPKVDDPQQKTNIALTHWRAPASCGVSCCYILLKLTGLNPSYDDVARLVPVEQAGSNLYSMNRACRQLGLNTEVIAATPADFDRLRWPAIIHYRPLEAKSDTMGHFVVVVGIDDHWVHILDSSYGESALRIPRGDFFRQWSGHLLLPAVARKIPANWIATLGYLLLVALMVILLMLSRRIIRVRYGPSVAKPIVSSPTLLLLVALPMLPILLTACSGPNDATSSASASFRQSSGKFDLTAWKVEEDCGALAKNGEACGKFPIENTGSVEAILEAGHPTCRCTTVTLDKQKLAPGETATLRMTLRREKQAGPTGANVILVALNQKWAQSFKIHGIVLGTSIPEDTIIVTAQHLADPLVIRGRVFTEHSNGPCEVAAAFEHTAAWEPKNTLTIGRIEISNPTPIGKCYVRDLAIPIVPVREGLAKLDVTRTTQLTVTVSRGNQRETHFVPFEVKKSAP